MTIYYNLYPDGRFSGHTINDAQYQQLSDEMKTFFTDVPYVNPQNGGLVYFNGTNWIEKPMPMDPTKTTIMTNSQNITKQSATLQQTQNIIMQQSQVLNKLQSVITQNTTVMNNMQKIMMQQANQIEALVSKETVNSASVSVKPSASSASTTSTNTSVTSTTTNDKEGK